MSRIASEINYSFYLDLNITEKLLPFVKVIVLGKTVSSSVEYFTGDGVNFSMETPIDNPEFDRPYYYIAFKKISKTGNSEKYRLHCKINIYIESDKTKEESYYGNPVQLLFLVSYLNTKGEYELRKYEA